MGGDGMASYLQFLRDAWRGLKEVDPTLPDFSMAQLKVLRLWMRQEAPKRYRWITLGPSVPSGFQYSREVIRVGIRAIHEPFEMLCRAATEAGVGKSQRKKAKRRKKK